MMRTLLWLFKGWYNYCRTNSLVSSKLTLESALEVRAGRITPLISANNLFLLILLSLLARLFQSFLSLPIIIIRPIQPCYV